MENEPLPFFRLEMEDGSIFHCNPQNTQAFLHSEQPEGDHLFPYLKTDDDEVVSGHYIFREQLGNFDVLIGRMAISGYVIHRNEQLSDDDKEAYDEFRARKERNLRLQQALKQESAYDLTPRQNRLANFVAYLLLHEHLSAEDFNGQGDLYI